MVAFGSDTKYCFGAYLHGHDLSLEGFVLLVRECYLQPPLHGDLCHLLLEVRREALESLVRVLLDRLEVHCLPLVLMAVKSATVGAGVHGWALQQCCSCGWGEFPRLQLQAIARAQLWSYFGYVDHRGRKVVAVPANLAEEGVKHQGYGESCLMGEIVALMAVQGRAAAYVLIVL